MCEYSELREGLGTEVVNVGLVRCTSSTFRCSLKAYETDGGWQLFPDYGVAIPTCCGLQG